MPAGKEIDGAAGVPEFYGKELRWQRERAGLTLEQTVRGVFYSVSYLSEIERGRRRMPLDLAQHVDRVLGTDGFFARGCEDVRNAGQQAGGHYFDRVREMQPRALDIVQWEPMLIPGALQLEPYIEALVQLSDPRVTSEVLKERVSTRRARSWLMDDKEGPISWLVVHESVLLQPLLGYADTAEQLAHVAAVARRGGFVPQVLPSEDSSVGAQPFLCGTTLLMEFDGAPPAVYTESAYSGHLVEGPVAVRQYRNAYDRLRATALPPELSLRLIESVAEDYRNGKRPRSFASRLMAKGGSGLGP
ncbi:Scr1 family TA system antitoxin-like transcriptional regulator [Streptomyces sp. NPDC051555]|uniref:helix-turn-helix domain-containing protein n=1 Tax=Streptomyces sp. NPDC051555 TaxID=3365657 RepID=UPI0037B8779F